MSRLPRYFRDLYLEPHNDGVRRSGLPADFGHFVDDAAASGCALELAGAVLSVHGAKALADAFGHVMVSILPAALDELVRARPDLGASYLVGTFALFVVGARAERLAPDRARLRELLRLALLDYFEDVADTYAGGQKEGLEREVDEMLASCAPSLEIAEVAFHFRRNERPRGERLLAYLFDARPRAFDAAPWPSVVEL